MDRFGIGTEIVPAVIGVEDVCLWITGLCMSKTRRCKDEGEVSDVLSFIAGATNPINLAGSRSENTEDEQLVIMYFAHEYTIRVTGKVNES